MKNQTELNDGNLAILYESGKGAVTFEKINVIWFLINTTKCKGAENDYD